MNIFKKLFTKHGMNKESILLEDASLENMLHLNFGSNEISLESLHLNTYKGLSFLVADDNIDQINIISNFLRKYGGDVYNAENGQAALELFLGDPDKYQIIIMDIQMPVMNGDEASRKIRESALQNAKSIPIIGISGNMELSSLNESSFTYFLQKPFPMEQLAYFVQCSQQKL